MSRVYSGSGADGNRYKTSKAAASHLTKNMSSTFAPYDIRVNAIAPGLFASELAQSTIDKAHIDKDKKPWEDGAFDKKNIPVGRIGRGKSIMSEWSCNTDRFRGGNGWHDPIPLLEGRRILQRHYLAPGRWQIEHAARLLDSFSTGHNVKQKIRGQSKCSIARSQYHTCIILFPRYRSTPNALKLPRAS